MFSTFTGYVSSLFYSTPTAATPAAAIPEIAFDQGAYQVGPATLQGSICNELQDNGYTPFTRSNLNTWAGIVQDARLSRHSKHPGHIYRDGKQLNFQTGEYYVDVSKAGNIQYQIKIKGSYYGIEVNEIADPTMKEIHANKIVPLLPQTPNHDIRLKR
jgi:hypothetical protein